MSFEFGLLNNVQFLFKAEFTCSTYGQLNWKVTDNSPVNFHDVFFFIFCQIIAKNEEKHVMELYG